MKQISEAAFEAAIEAVLLNDGYSKLSSGAFDAERAIFPAEALGFIRATQAKTWKKLEALHGAETGERVLQALCKWLDSHGALTTLRHGFKCFGKTLRIAFFRPAHGLNPELEARYRANRLNAILDQAAARFKKLQEEQEQEAELWRGKAQAFRNLYTFLSQVIPYQDSELEKLFAYLRHLAPKLPRRKSGLNYYCLQKISEGSIALDEGYARPLDGPREVGSGMVREDQVPLSRLIDLINTRFGSELNEADQLFFDQIAEAAGRSEPLRKAASVNSLEKFQLVFREVLESLFIERMELNEELFTDYMSKPEMQELVSKWLGAQVYQRLTESKQAV